MPSTRRRTPAILTPSTKGQSRSFEPGVEAVSSSVVFTIDNFRLVLCSIVLSCVDQAFCTAAKGTGTSLLFWVPLG